MTKTKKIILFIVEGFSDETILDKVYSNYFERQNIRFHTVRGDITSDNRNKTTNIKNVICQIIKNFIAENKLKKSDIFKVVQVIDTDAAFILDTSITEKGILERNDRKTKIVKLLSSTSKIFEIDYEIYYFSKNLEHLLHGIDDELENNKKKLLSKSFINSENPSDKFFKIVNTYNQTIIDYNRSWEFIFESDNSNKRSTNIHILKSDCC